jgi:hypothetical protein
VALGRRSTTTATDVVEPVEQEPVEAGKGRPTPKRSDSRKARRGAVPRNRKEAAQIRRDKLRTERSKTRQALVTGDERHLPPRDAGPEKRLARDVIDSRFTLGQMLFGFMLVALALSFAKASIINLIATAVILVMFVTFLVDAYVNGGRAKTAVAERFGDDRTMGIRAYGMTRSMLPRRFRKPPPKVERGDSPRR